MSFYAHDCHHERLVFIKAASSEAGRLALLREAAILSELAHSQIPALLDAGSSEGMAFIVTQPMPRNRFLSAWFKRYAAPRAAARLVASALAPLEYVHDRKIVHRDIKTENLPARFSGQVGLVDFGISVFQGAKDFQPPGRVIGTARYIAPERARGEPGTPASDIYSMGIVLYELLYGIVPFDDDNHRDVASRHCSTDIDLQRTNGRPVPQHLVAIVSQAIQKDPADRYDSAPVMREDIMRYLALTRPL